jgi:hypothetical protein
MKPYVLPFLLCTLAASAVSAQTFDTSANAVAQDLNTIGGDTAARHAQPSTMPFIAYSNSRRLAHVSGVFLVDGQPVPNALVNVTAEVEGGFVADHQVRTDRRGVYNDWFEAEAPIQSVSVEPLTTDSESGDADVVSKLFPAEDAQ